MFLSCLRSHSHIYNDSIKAHRHKFRTWKKSFKSFSSLSLPDDILHFPICRLSLIQFKREKSLLFMILKFSNWFQLNYMLESSFSVCWAEKFSYLRFLLYTADKTISSNLSRWISSCKKASTIDEKLKANSLLFPIHIRCWQIISPILCIHSTIQMGLILEKIHR